MMGRNVPPKGGASIQVHVLPSWWPFLAFQKMKQGSICNPMAWMASGTTRSVPNSNSSLLLLESHVKDCTICLKVLKFCKLEASFDAFCSFFFFLIYVEKLDSQFFSMFG